MESLKALFANSEIWRLALIAIGVGVGIGIVVVIAILLFRRRQFWSHASEELVGAKGTVEVAFDEACNGKVRLQVAHRTIGCMAYSGESYRFEAGDPVVVVGIRGDKVWVIPASEF